MTAGAVPQRLAAAVAAAGIAGVWVQREAPGGLPADPGAYVLALRTAGEIQVSLPRTGAAMLPPGRYLYLGSARGPGGIRARVGRHFRPEKPRRWHIDRLTLEADEMAALPVPAGHECDLVERLLASGRFRVAMPGFGSTDCRRCASHLLAFSGETRS